MPRDKAPVILPPEERGTQIIKPTEPTKTFGTIYFANPIASTGTSFSGQPSEQSAGYLRLLAVARDNRKTPVVMKSENPKTYRMRPV